MFFFLMVRWPTWFSPLSLHAALPICVTAVELVRAVVAGQAVGAVVAVQAIGVGSRGEDVRAVAARQAVRPGAAVERVVAVDRKSTRLNSSHANISYAVFCLKKKISHV